MFSEMTYLQTKLVTDVFLNAIKACDTLVSRYFCGKEKPGVYPWYLLFFKFCQSIKL